MAAKTRESIVDRKVRLTASIAGLGTLSAIISGLLGVMEVFYASLLVIALSPFISLIIVVRRG